MLDWLARKYAVNNPTELAETWYEPSPAFARPDDQIRCI